MTERLADTVGALLAQVEPSSSPVSALAPCGAPYLPYVTEPRESGITYCDGRWHYDLAGHLGTCPVVRAKEVRDRVSHERRRLAAEIGKIERRSRFGFDGFNPRRHPSAARALAVMRRFARPSGPDSNVLLVGPSGLGKTHLLLASHLALLEAGVPSVYVRTPEMRRLFRDAENFDPDVSEPARAALDPILYTSAVHFDDVGHIEGDQRSRGQFAEGLKDLLDRSRGRWAVATNRSGTEAEHHPDLSGTIASRFMHDAEIVDMDGIDFRVETARHA